MSMVVNPYVGTFGGGGAAACPTITTFADQVLYDYSVDGAANELVLQGCNTGRSFIFIRDVAFASADRLGIYVSEDCAATKEDSAAEYEGRSLYVAASGGASGSDAGFTSSAVLSGDATTGPHDAIVEITGMGSQALRTAFRTFASDAATVHSRRFNRAIARSENGLIIASIAGQNMTAGQIVARTYPGNESIDLAVLSMWVGAAS